jgi:hypothetical protein
MSETSTKDFVNEKTFFRIKQKIRAASRFSLKTYLQAANVEHYIRANLTHELGLENAIKNFSINTIDVCKSSTMYNVSEEFEQKPGDLIIKNDKIVGMIVAVDDENKSTVLAAHGMEHRYVNVIVSVQFDENVNVSVINVSTRLDVDDE